MRGKQDHIHKMSRRLCSFDSHFGDVTYKATIQIEAEVEAHFLAKEDWIVTGIALAEMVFNEVDPSLKVKWHRKMVIVYIKVCNLAKYKEELIILLYLKGLFSTLCREEWSCNSD